MKPQSFLKGPNFAGCRIITKALGALFIIPLTRLIGPKALASSDGITGFRYGVSACASGIPVAIAKLVSERLASRDESGARQVVPVCLWVMVPVDCYSHMHCSGSRFHCSFRSQRPRVFFPLRCLSPAIVFIACSAVFGGYFQGCRIMAPTAICHVTEQVVRVVVGLG